jgi:ribosome-associated toxin RatA of RatAB toxin-antitoxin module
MTSRRSIEVDAPPELLFALSQDYGRRLSWDPFLREARLLGGAGQAGLGVRAWCEARNGLGMETAYVSFHPPRACAVEMTRGPRCFRAFAGSWRFEPIGPGRSRVSFTYRVVARPSALTRPLSWIFGRHTRRRLDALKRAAEAASSPLESDPSPLSR